MAKPKQTFICQNCGTAHSRWQGRCEGCGEWNTLVEETTAAAPPLAGGVRAGRGRRIPLEGLQGATADAPRVASGIAELDRVTGGGFVRGSVLLLGGEPGIGKSTLLIQAAAALARLGRRVAYISGEEAAAQVRLRAERLGLADAPVELAAETNVDDIVATLSDGRTPALVIIDSIQTMWTAALDACARHGDAGPRQRADADPLRQDDGRLRDSGGACDEGRADRGPPRCRAHGGRRHLLRGRRRA